MPLSSTKRTDGAPSGVEVASAMASGSRRPRPRPARTSLESAAAGRSHRHRDVLDLQVLVDALLAALAAEAGSLHAAERRRGVGHHALVEPDHAGLQLLAHAEGALDVARVDVGDE